MRHYDWNGAVQPLVGQMLQASGVNAGSILLVDSVNNRTNGSLNAGEATTALRSALAGNGKFTGIGAAAGGRQQQPGPVAAGQPRQPQQNAACLQTGEIIWSGKGAVQQQ